MEHDTRTHEQQQIIIILKSNRQYYINIHKLELNYLLLNKNENCINLFR